MRGVPSKIQTVVRVFAPRIVAPRFREKTGMKDATKRATSAALAHMLAVTAMLVIASVLFYRVEKSSQSKAQAVRQIEQSAH